jgi:hypothetical protein
LNYIKDKGQGTKDDVSRRRAKAEERMGSIAAAQPLQYEAREPGGDDKRHHGEHEDEEEHL